MFSYDRAGQGTKAKRCLPFVRCWICSLNKARSENWGGAGNSELGSMWIGVIASSRTEPPLLLNKDSFQAGDPRDIRHDFPRIDEPQDKVLA
jgi:hypothetical protein